LSLGRRTPKSNFFVDDRFTPTRTEVISNRQLLINGRIIWHDFQAISLYFLSSRTRQQIGAGSHSQRARLHSDDSSLSGARALPPRAHSSRAGSSPAFCFREPPHRPRPAVTTKAANRVLTKESDSTCSTRWAATSRFPLRERASPPSAIPSPRLALIAGAALAATGSGRSNLSALTLSTGLLSPPIPTDLLRPRN